MIVILYSKIIEEEEEEEEEEVVTKSRSKGRGNARGAVSKTGRPRRSTAGRGKGINLNEWKFQSRMNHFLFDLFPFS